jgi:uncharacterized protein YaeQ
MAQPHTLHNISIDLADVDRNVYATFALKVARHPSESDDFLVGRILAYCLEYREGIEFSRGVSSTDEPAIMIRDLTGQVTDWIEMGTPSAERLHKASKATKRVAVYLHRAPGPYLKQLAAERIHRLESIAFVGLDRQLIKELVERLDRRMSLGVSITEGRMFVAIGNDMLDGAIETLSVSGD